ncbi:MAG: hypothetical protein E7354_04595 [Clostridiales bacterium]|nr:hypothetical protein [Clostridiales bacterium]
MNAFRLCDEAEVKSILDSHSFEGLGKPFEQNPKLNNHKYEDNRRYLHFFKDLGSIFYLYPDTGKYICTYDFPQEILEGSMGQGKYLDYFFFRNLQLVGEYAIPEDLLKFSHLISISLINKGLEVEDYIEDSSLNSFVTNIYDARENQPTNAKN